MAGKVKEVNLRDLKKACKELIDSGEVEKFKFVAVKTKVMVESFINAVHSIEDEDDIPQGVKDFYNTIHEDHFPDTETEDKETEEAEVEVTEEDEVEDEVEDDINENDEAEPDDEAETDEEEPDDKCPAFGTGHNPKSTECKSCKKDFPDEFKDCKIMTKGRKSEKTEKKTKKTVEKSRYGHLLGSMSARIDDLVCEGTTEKKAVKILMKEFKKEERLAKAKFRSHVGYLPGTKGVTVDKSDKGVFKAVEADLSEVK